MKNKTNTELPPAFSQWHIANRKAQYSITRSDLLHHQPAINGEHSAGDERRFIAREE